MAGPGCGEECSPGKCVDQACVPCVPDCTGRVCGDDGCGGICGTCTNPCTHELDPAICVEGQCPVPCCPDCLGKECGPDGQCLCGGVDEACCPSGKKCDADLVAVALDGGPCGCYGTCQLAACDYHGTPGACHPTTSGKGICKGLPVPTANTCSGSNCTTDWGTSSGTLCVVVGGSNYCYDPCVPGGSGCDPQHECKRPDEVSAKGFCRPCEPKDHEGCHDGDVYWISSCGQPSELIEDCAPDEECVGGVCGGCYLSCNIEDGKLFISFGCADGGSKTCDYDYNPNSSVKSMTCSYDNGAGYTCKFEYNTFGEKKGSCDSGSGSCTFAEY